MLMQNPGVIYGYARVSIANMLNSSVPVKTGKE